MMLAKLATIFASQLVGSECGISEDTKQRNKSVASF